MCGGSKTQTATTTSGPPQQVQDAYKNLLGQAQGVASAKYDPNTGKQVAGFTAPQQQAFQGVANAQGAWQPYLTNAGSAAASGVAPVTTQSILDNYSPYVKAQTDAVQANLNQQNAQTLQQVNSNAAKIGALTGDRSQIAAQQATNDNNRNAAAAVADIQSRAFGQAAEISQNNAARSLQGAGVYGALGTQAQNAGYTDIDALLGVGALQQGQQQNVYDAASANAAAAAQFPYQNLSWLSSIYGNSLPGFGSTTTSTTPGPNPWAQAIGAGLGVASLASDARVKEGITPVGQMFDGTPIYKFNYKGSPATQIGVMAQDIERRMPEAVSEGVSGIKSVNYDMATQPSAQIGGGASNGTGLGELLKGVAHAREAFAGGGSVYNGAWSYVPDVELAPAHFAAPSAPSQSNAGGGLGGVADILSSMKSSRDAEKGMSNVGSWLRTTKDPESGWSTTVNPAGLGGLGSYLSNGVVGIFGRKHGGGVRGFEGGGVVDPLDDIDGEMSPYGGVGEPALSGVAGNAGFAYEPGPTPPSGVAGADFAPTGVHHAPMARAAPAPSGGLLGLMPVSDNARDAMMATGLGMLASGSPFIGTAIGEGGMAGLKTYKAGQQQEAENRQRDNAIALRAQRLTQEAERQRELQKYRTSQAEGLNTYRQAQVGELKSRQDSRAKRDGMRDTILKMLNTDAAAEVAPPTSSIIPQSYNLPSPGDPNLRSVADVTPEQELATEAAQARAPAAVVGEEEVAEAAPRGGSPADVISTPFGQMTRDKASRVGGAMLLDPSTAAAGKALIDIAQQQVNPGLGKSAVTALQEKQLNTTEAYARLGTIEAGYKPEFQTIENRLGNKWSEWMDSFGATRKTLTPQQKAQLGEYAAFRADAINNLNQYVKEITGAAMTNAEAGRIMQAMPNPGDGVFNGDSPTVFKSKLDVALRNSRMALARYNYLAKNGFKGGVDEMAKRVPLERMSSIINDRAAEITREVQGQNQGLDRNDVMPIVRQRLRSEFGMEL